MTALAYIEPPLAPGLLLRSQGFRAPRLTIWDLLWPRLARRLRRRRSR